MIKWCKFFCEIVLDADTIRAVSALFRCDGQLVRFLDVMTFNGLGSPIAWSPTCSAPVCRKGQLAWIRIEWISTLSAVGWDEVQQTRLKDGVKFNGFGSMTAWSSGGSGLGWRDPRLTRMARLTPMNGEIRWETWYDKLKSV